MAVMNFDLEDGLPPISFTLRNDEVTRFMDFLAECQAIKESPQRKPLTDECERDCCGNTFKKVSEVCSRICPNVIKPK